MEADWGTHGTHTVRRGIRQTSTRCGARAAPTATTTRGSSVGFYCRIFASRIRRSASVACDVCGARTNSAMGSIALGDHDGAMSNGEGGDDGCALLDVLSEDLIRVILNHALKRRYYGDEKEMVHTLSMCCKTFKTMLNNHAYWTDLMHHYCSVDPTGDFMESENEYKELVRSMRWRHKTTRDVHVAMGRAIKNRYWPVSKREEKAASKRLEEAVMQRMMFFNKDEDREILVNLVLSENWGDAILVDSQNRFKDTPVTLKFSHGKRVTPSESKVRWTWSMCSSTKTESIRERIRKIAANRARERGCDEFFEWGNEWMREMYAMRRLPKGHPDIVEARRG